jgi:hypothetical protein
METGFKDPIKIPEDKHKQMKSPWNFDQPHYDNRSSIFVNAGSHYGIGHKQPVGHKEPVKNEISTLPMDRRKVKAMKTEEVQSDKNLDLEIQE